MRETVAKGNGEVKPEKTEGGRRVDNILAVIGTRRWGGIRRRIGLQLPNCPLPPAFISP